MSSSSSTGSGWGFPPSFGSKGKDVKLVSDMNEINEALEILFSTALEERLNRPDYGCDLKQFMFEEIDNSLVLEVQQIIINAVSNYEQRIVLENIDISEIESIEGGHKLLISLDYFLSSDSVVKKFVYELPLY